MKKRALSIVLTLALCLGMLPATAWAEQDPDPAPASQEVTSQATPAEQDVTLGVRPDHLMLCADGIKGIVDVSEMMGSEMHLHMTVSGHDVIAVIPTAGLSLDDVRAGGTAHFTFDPELMHLFDPKTEENLFPVENSKAKV